MNVSDETRRTVRWVLLGLLAVQVLIVPWNAPVMGGMAWTSSLQYAPIFAPPSPTAPLAPRATIDMGRLLIQLVVTGGAAVAWMAFTRPKAT